MLESIVDDGGDRGLATLGRRRTWLPSRSIRTTLSQCQSVNLNKRAKKDDGKKTKLEPQQLRFSCW